MSYPEKISAGFVIMNPLTGDRMKQTPTGISLEGVIFPTKKDLVEFVEKHWENPVFMEDGQDLLPPD